MCYFPKFIHIYTSFLYFSFNHLSSTGFRSIPC
nr:MAG TPA: hypothetical protein [Caudoviricetes sp.]